MRRFHTGFRRSMRRKQVTAWIPLTDGTGIAALAANTLTSRVPFATPAGTNAGFIQPNQCTVQRVEMDVLVASSGVFGSYIWLLYIADMPGGATDLWNPTTNANFASKKVLAFGSGMLQTAGFAPPNPPHYSIRTKRKMTGEQAIVWTFQANVATSITFNSRVLISGMA